MSKWPQPILSKVDNIVQRREIRICSFRVLNRSSRTSYNLASDSRPWRRRRRQLILLEDVTFPTTTTSILKLVVTERKRPENVLLALQICKTHHHRRFLCFRRFDDVFLFLCNNIYSVSSFAHRNREVRGDRCLRGWCSSVVTSVVSDILHFENRRICVWFLDLLHC